MNTGQVKKIAILTTGGTIEKTYSEEEGSLENRESLLRQKLLKKLRLPGCQISVKVVMSKDSLYMIDEDREKIFNSLAQHFKKTDAILVLHGTDTLDKTLKYCYERMPKPPIPVVFTGAMKPAGFDDSDALQNFTEALFASQIVKPGYYLSFHGQLFIGPNVKKNKDLRTFEGVRFSSADI